MRGDSETEEDEESLTGPVVDPGQAVSHGEADDAETEDDNCNKPCMQWSPETCSYPNHWHQRRLPDEHESGHHAAGELGEVETVLEDPVDDDEAGDVDVEVEQVGTNTDEVSCNLNI